MGSTSACHGCNLNEDDRCIDEEVHQLLKPTQRWCKTGYQDPKKRVRGGGRMKAGSHATTKRSKLGHYRGALRFVVFLSGYRAAQR